MFYRIIRNAFLGLVIVGFALLLAVPATKASAAEGCSASYTISNFNHVDFSYQGLPDGWLTLHFGDGSQTDFEVANGNGGSSHDYPYPGGDYTATVDGHGDCDLSFTISWDVQTGGGGHRAGQANMPPSIDNAVLSVPDWYVPGHDYQLWGLKGAFITVKDGTLGIDNFRQDKVFPGQELTFFDATTGEKHRFVVNDPWGPKNFRFCLPGTTEDVVVSPEGYCAVVPKQ